MTARFLTEFTPDDPVELAAGYRFRREDRRFIDEQIQAIEILTSQDLLLGTHATRVRLSPSSAAGAAGDCVVLSTVDGQQAFVTRAVAAALALAPHVFGVLLEACAPGAWARIAIGGLVPQAITGLATGAAGFVAVNTTTARAARVAAFTSSSFPLGSVDASGNLTLALLPTGNGVSGGLRLFDHFCSNSSASALGWTSTTNGTGATAAATALSANSSHPGELSISTGTTTTGRCALSLGSANPAFFVSSVENLEQEWIFTLPNLSDGTDTYLLQMGIGDEIGGTQAQTNGIFFEYDQGGVLATASPNWKICCAAAGTTTRTTTSAAVATTAHRKLRVTKPAGSTTVTFSIDGAVVGTISTNVPTVAVMPFAKIYKSAGTTARVARLDKFDHIADAA